MVYNVLMLLYPDRIFLKVLINKKIITIKHHISSKCVFWWSWMVAGMWGYIVNIANVSLLQLVDGTIYSIKVRNWKLQYLWYGLKD